MTPRQQRQANHAAVADRFGAVAVRHRVYQRADTGLDEVELISRRRLLRCSAQTLGKGAWTGTPWP